MNTSEAFCWGVVLNNPTREILQAISDEPLLIYYQSGETHYIAWKIVLPIGSLKPTFDKWCGKVPIRELTEALNRLCSVVGQDATLTFGSLRLYIKYPYTSHHINKIRAFLE